MRLSISIKANAMLLILWMMLMHTAFPHVHHEYEEHTHHGTESSHSHEHNGKHNEGPAEKKSLIDLFFHNHSHSNHLPQTIAVNHEKSDLFKKDNRKIVELSVFSNQKLSITLKIEPEKLKNQGILGLESPFFTCKTLRGPPVLG